MIYFVRHGETDYNKQGRAQGHMDIPLNETGLMQAKTVAKALKNTKLDVIYSSPLQRAKVTADTINTHHNVEVICDDRLKELYLGDRQGVVLRDCSKDELDEFFKDPKKFGAESYDELCSRVEDMYKSIEQMGKTKNILIVAHGGVYRAIARYIMGLDSVHSEKIQSLKNCEVVNFSNMAKEKDLG